MNRSSWYIHASWAADFRQIHHSLNLETQSPCSDCDAGFSKCWESQILELKQLDQTGADTRLRQGLADPALQVPLLWTSGPIAVLSNNNADSLIRLTGADLEASPRSSRCILINPKGQKKVWNHFSILCVSSLREGHANLLCIVPNLSDAPKSNLIELAGCICSKITSTSWVWEDSVLPASCLVSTSCSCSRLHPHTACIRARHV